MRAGVLPTSSWPCVMGIPPGADWVSDWVVLAGQSVDDPGWQEQYERAVLDPWIQLITSRGASVLWLGNPTVGNEDAIAGV